MNSLLMEMPRPNTGDWNLILVSKGNFQEYILDNLRHLIKLKIKNIYVITNLEFFVNFGEFENKITLIDYKTLDEKFKYNDKSTQDKKFRKGFWRLTSERFFYVYALIEKLDLKDCFHIENDVLIYYNPEILNEKLDKNFMYIPFDTFKRNIASIIYIPNKNIFKQILDNYNYSLNDMENFSIIKKKTNLIKNFPIFIDENSSNLEEKFVSENYSLFNYIFDAAAMGQYLGGVDPRNNPSNTVGFVNETCVIKYNRYSFIWEDDIIDYIKKPYLFLDNNKIPIFNLHIHCKNLRKFIIS